MSRFFLSLILLLPGLIFANEFEELLKELASSDIERIAQSAIVVNAVKEQNNRHQSLTEKQIISLDDQWRAEVGSSNSQLIDGILSNALSKNLMEVQADSDGLYTEIFVMDNKGLNVGQSSVTSDYWQGDEAKWQDTYGKGSGAVHIGDIEEDESTQTFQSQVSITVTDPDSGKAIGAITVGVDVNML